MVIRCELLILIALPLFTTEKINIENCWLQTYWVVYFTLQLRWIIISLNFTDFLLNQSSHMFQGPTLRSWYTILDKIVKGTGKSAALQKVALDQVIMCVCVCVCVCLSFNFLWCFL